MSELKSERIIYRYYIVDEIVLSFLLKLEIWKEIKFDSLITYTCIMHVHVLCMHMYYACTCIMHVHVLCMHMYYACTCIYIIDLIVL